MTRHTLVFFDHAPHRWTESTLFLRNTLRNNFLITDMWDDECSLNDTNTIEEINNYEFVLFFQHLPKIKELFKIKAKIIWVPMLDSAVLYQKNFWIQLSTFPIKVVSFSAFLSKRIRSFGIEVFDVQYYLDPRCFKAVSNYRERNVFFWQRTDITLIDLKKIFKSLHINKIVLKVDPDPGHRPYYPTDEEIKEFNISLIKGKMDRNDYNNLLQRSKCNIFVAPRKREGIGMSFIEAMCCGMVVLSLDHPTMNEYITDGVSGILFNGRKEMEMQNGLSIARIGRTAREECFIGYSRWLVSQKEIIKFLNGPFSCSGGINTKIRFKVFFQKVFDWIRLHLSFLGIYKIDPESLDF